MIIEFLKSDLLEACTMSSTYICKHLNSETEYVGDAFIVTKDDSILFNQLLHKTHDYVCMMVGKVLNNSETTETKISYNIKDTSLTDTIKNSLTNSLELYIVYATLGEWFRYNGQVELKKLTDDETGARDVAVRHFLRYVRRRKLG